MKISLLSIAFVGCLMIIDPVESGKYSFRLLLPFFFGKHEKAGLQRKTISGKDLLDTTEGNPQIV